MNPLVRRGIYQPRPLSPEFRALLACVRDDPPEALEERLGAPGSDDSELLRLARDHVVLSLVYSRLERAGLQTALTPAAWERLAKAHLTIVARQTRMISAALEIIRGFERAGLRCLPLKGTAMIAATWPDYLPRDMCDLDLLVAPEQAEAAAQVLEQRGFVIDRDSFGQCPWSPHPVKARTPELSLDLHTAPWGRMPLEPPRPSFAELWERGRPGALLDREVRVPAPEDMVLTHIAAAARDRFFTVLRTWADLRNLLERSDDPPEHKRLCERAESLQAGRLLEICMCFLGELTQQAPEVWDRGVAHSETYASVRAILWRRLMTGPSADVVPRSALRLLAGGAQTGADLDAAARAWAAEQGGPVARWGRLGTALGLAGGAVAYAARLLVSGEARQALREERRLLRAVRER